MQLRLTTKLSTSGLHTPYSPLPPPLGMKLHGARMAFSFSMFLANNAFVLRLPVLAVANRRPLISDSFFVVGESMASEGEM